MIINVNVYLIRRKCKMDDYKVISAQTPIGANATDCLKLVRDKK